MTDILTPERVRDIDEEYGVPEVQDLAKSHEALHTERDAALARADAAEYANRTRPDYNLRCQDCGRAHILDTSIPSEIWEQITQDGAGILCITCIDERLAKAGLIATAQFYYVGTARQSQLYSEPDEALRDQVEQVTRERDQWRELAKDAWGLVEALRQTHTAWGSRSVHAETWLAALDAAEKGETQ